MNHFATLTNDLMISRVEHAPFFTDGLFKLKFGENTPDYGYGVVCFYRKDWRHFVPLCYLNFLPYDEVLLVGGAMTDGAVFRMMPEKTKSTIKKLGGIYFQSLKFSFDSFKDDCEAFFGYTGDERAYEAGIRAGFEPTGHEYLIANFHKPITAERKSFLIEKIHAIGPF
ncbi:MAG: hypothetical protein GWM87_05370 [Xanthomonadales bacterium]|nr:hypothetical protein [Xanthomonadales bacterium]NIX12417.1 hypothetical protein [Xanthomonadales bacterium]